MNDFKIHVDGPTARISVDGNEVSHVKAVRLDARYGEAPVLYLEKVAFSGELSGQAEVKVHDPDFNRHVAEALKSIDSKELADIEAQALSRQGWDSGLSLTESIVECLARRFRE